MIVNIFTLFHELSIDPSIKSIFDLSYSSIRNDECCYLYFGLGFTHYIEF